MKAKFLLSIYIAITILTSSCAFLSPTPIAVTGNLSTSELSTNHLSPAPSLREFTQQVINGRSDLPTGVYVPGVMAYPLVQQPSNDAAFVSTKAETLTQFRMASQYKSTGILAHDYLAGTSFFNLKVGQDVTVVYGDGSMRFYRIYEVQKYQALTPTSPYSNFVDLSTNLSLSAENLFYRTYGLGNNTLVFQTCISTDKVSSWGRLFVLARPVENSTLALAQYMPNIEKALVSAARVLTANTSLTANR